ncbi:MAG TPA: hypothetical protein IAB65_01180 [Candidatus Onthocola stercorigallinarum]|nr:hypothetical protein [Candidatus Onthocola stercorigallinarum]
MAGLINGIRKILLNRNTVTIIAVIAGVIVLWFFYNMTLNNAINPVRVPVATREILAGELISSDDIDYVEVNRSFLNNASIITNSSQLVGYYVNFETSIPEGGMFYSNQVVTHEEISETASDNLPDGYTLYWLNLEDGLDDTYANSIYPGDKIDLWISGRDPETGLIIYDEFINSIDVLQVIDSDNKNVFDDAANRTPDKLGFAVTDEMNKYLIILVENGFELYPVPRNKTYTVDGKDVSYSNDTLVDLVESLYQPYGEV